MRARIAGHTRSANQDPTQRKAVATAGQGGLFARFERQVAEQDPDGLLSPAERRYKAEQLRSAYMARLAFESSKARKAGRK